MSYSVTAIEDIDPDEIDALKSAGVRTTEKLLEGASSPKGRKVLAAKTGISEKRLLHFANIADVDTVKELKYRNPERLAKSMADINKKRKLVRFLPSEKLVTRWVEHAKKLPLKITY
jgi:hypothetical protein